MANDQQSVLIVNGPNLNMLGLREPSIYGADTLADIEAACSERADDLDLSIDFRQSNHEGVLIDWIHEARGAACGIAINPAAYTHTSIALLDALSAFDGPVIEVHLSNIHRRETFRHWSYVSQRADAVIAGFGMDGYAAAVHRICKLVG